MASVQSTSLVKFDRSSKALTHSIKASVDPFKLVRDDVHLVDRDAVKKFLPDILGRALARMWIDNEFQISFSEYPKGALENAGVYLPEEMTIEFSKKISDRPKIIVYEKPNKSKFKIRILYLQLVMLAGM